MIALSGISCDRRPVVLALATILLGTLAGPGWLWLSAALAYGFLARVLTGPRLSPLGQLATRLLAPRIGHAKLVPGPPKRFAQGVGAILTVAAVALLALGHPAVTIGLLTLVVVAATLESVFACCVGCKIFALCMRLGLVPERTCAACADITGRHPQSA